MTYAYNLDMSNLQGEITTAVCCASAEGWGVSFGRWNQNAPTLLGFDSPLDAWCFAVAHGFNPSAGIPDRLDQWTKRPPLPEPELQPSLFQEHP